MRKKLTAFSAALLLLLSMGGVCFASDDQNTQGSSIVLDSKKLETTAVTKDETLYLPVRDVCEALGYEITWSSENGIDSVTAEKSGKSIIVDVTDQIINDNGHSYAMIGDFQGGSCIFIDGHVYLQAGLLSEAFGISCGTGQSGETVLTTQSQNDIDITNVKISSETDVLSTKIQYPQISMPDSPEAQNAINETLKQAALAAQDEGKKYADENAEYLSQNGLMSKFETCFDYRIKYNENGLLSLILLDYQYTGGAHGSTFQTACTFDIKTGKSLEIGDFFKKESGYTAYIDASIKSAVDTKVASGTLYEIADFSDIGDNPYFYLSDDGMVFFFQQYEYFPYAAGIQEFTIKYGDVKDMIDAEYGFLYSPAIDLDMNAENHLTTGAVGKVTLSGNPTTGYSWHCSIDNPDIVEEVSDNYVSAAKGDVVGSGGKYTFNFRALKAGRTTITFKYYKDWEGEKTAAENAVYTIVVA